jgi:hypothetical protein
MMALAFPWNLPASEKLAFGKLEEISKGSPEEKREERQVLEKLEVKAGREVAKLVKVEVVKVEVRSVSRL